MSASERERVTLCERGRVTLCERELSLPLCKSELSLPFCAFVENNQGHRAEERGGDERARVEERGEDDERATLDNREL